MKRLSTIVFVQLFFYLAAPAWANSDQSAQAIAPKTPMEWFQRAADEMSIRAPGAKPFHMKVSFHAYPGIELLGKNQKSLMAQGDGLYEETWLDVHTWRREVRLADYHAIEEDSNGVRKMQTSSGYEPSRVLMLLDALLSPVPRNLISNEFKSDLLGWRVKTIQNEPNPKQFVCFSKNFASGEAAVRANVSSSFCFLSHGTLVFRNEKGLVTTWGNDIIYGSKIVPQSIAVNVGDRTLISAQAIIEPVGPVDPSSFNLPTGPADPGMTLRPLHRFEVRMSQFQERRSWVSFGGSAPPVGYSIRAILDRDGRYKDVELIEALKQADPKTTMDFMRTERNDPATIDGKRCEVVIDWAIY